MLRKKFKTAAKVIAKTSLFHKGFKSSRFLNKKPAPELVPDILEHIFWMLTESSEDGVPSLESYTNLLHCMLVNKTWCAAAASLLHKHPWRLDRTYTVRTTDMAYEHCKIVQLYLSLLNQNERSLLLEKGIEIPEPNSTPMFNYPEFVKYLDYGVMVASIWTIYSTSCYTYDKNEWVSLVARSLLRLLAEHSGRLQWLRCAPMSFSFDEMYYSLLADSEFSGLFSPVQGLVIAGNLGGDKKLFRILAETFRNLNYLEIRDLPRARNWQGDSSSWFSTDFSSIIKCQAGLESLVLKECAGYLGSIINTIPNQATTLRVLKFIDCDFRGCSPWEGIELCTKLERIEFDRCINITSPMVKPLSKAPFPFLRKVITFADRDQPPICPELMSWACRYP
ncbi:hypothetical protein G9A89_018277 [Geosiphon pyriformis]|nr:hypothetical protein G9A89_018277 [Geosiphon pyriformis]